MIRLLAPSGMPISPLRILSSSLSAVFSDSAERFSRLVKLKLNARHCFLVNSARTGLSLMLRSLVESGDGRNEVIIPAYTCYSVAAAVVRAGLKIRTVDIDPDSFDFDYAKLAETDLDRVLAIIPDSLFGLVADFDRLRHLQSDSKPYLIDDAAQAFGSLQQGRPVGNLGDVGVISFDRGKNLTTYTGGVVLTDSQQLADRIGRQYEQLPPASAGCSVLAAGKSLMYSLFIRPSLFRLPASLPFLGLGETIYDVGFPMSRLGGFQSALGCRMIGDLDRINEHRRANGLNLAERIRGESQYRIPLKINKSTICLRLPVYAQNKDHRDRVIARLRQAGVVASQMYPSTIPSIDQVREYLVEDQSRQSDDYPGATMVTERVFTLPTHPFVTAADLDRMVDCLKEVN